MDFPSRARAYAVHNSLIRLPHAPSRSRFRRIRRAQPRHNLTSASALNRKSETPRKGGGNVFEVGDRRGRFPYVAPRPFLQRRPFGGLRRMLPVTGAVARPILRNGIPAGFRFDGIVRARVHGIRRGEGFPFGQPGALLRASDLIRRERTPAARVATAERPLLRTISRYAERNQRPRPRHRRVARVHEERREVFQLQVLGPERRNAQENCEGNRPDGRFRNRRALVSMRR